MQFDGKEWVLPEGFGELSEEALKNGVCFTADANVPAGVAFEDMGFDKLLTHPVRFALRGQEGVGAILDVLTADKVAATRAIVVAHGEGEVSVACMPFVNAAGDPPADVRTGGMSDDFEGLEDFMSIVREGVKKAENAKEIPRVILTVRSKTSFGMVVRLLQLIRSAGCKSGLVRVDDDFPGSNFEVRMDTDVEPPAAKLPQGEAAVRGRIVVEILADGTLVDGDSQVLADESAVEDYVGRERLRFETEGFAPKLHLRGEPDSVFKHSRSVIRSAANAGVDQVVFTVYKEPQRKIESFLKARETDLALSIPKQGEELPDDADDNRVSVDISLDAKGRVSLTDEEGFLDTDAAERDLPLLKAKLTEATGENGHGEKELKITLRADPLASQQRVIDVLNLLAQLGISSVTFANVKAEE